MNDTLLDVLPELTEEQRARFCAYYALLCEWNTRVNLTRVTGKRDVAEKHFADSLAAAALLQPGARTIDVGTGAGFPGVPLLIVRPDLELTLLDALDKRLRFLETLCRELGLTARLVHARAEDAGRDPEHRGAYDAALSRAVAPLPTLLELTVPFLCEGGTAVAYKGDAAAELVQSRSACRALGCALEIRDVSAAYGVRTLVLARKTAPTPAAYPRRAGLPEKRPL